MERIKKLINEWQFYRGKENEVPLRFLDEERKSIATATLSVFLELSEEEKEKIAQEDLVTIEDMKYYLEVIA